MSDNNTSSSFWGLIKGFGKFLVGLILVVQGFVGLAVLLLIAGIIAGFSNGMSGKPNIEIPKEAALLINPKGILVEQAEATDPIEEAIEELYGINGDGQIGVHDLVRSIRAAKSDDRIKGIVLDLGQFFIPSSSASKAHYLAREIAAFKESGKPVVSIGDYYSQEGYMLASHADKVMMHDQGSLILVGYGRYRTYYKSFLEKIKATSNVFRVGTFKSAVEPYLRDDMSDAAKEANSAYLSSLWGAYVKEVADARGLSQDVVLAYANDFNAELSNAKGDLAEAAQNAGFIDQIGSREDMRATLVEMFGSGDEDDSDFKNVTYKKYLTALGEKETTDAPDVGIVTVAGTIVDGEADAGEAAGGDSVASLLKKARKDDNVKAVVLRVDSPGGSSFASEIIRDELIAIKDAGKPVVVSMGSLAASGGYWVSAPADEIWAAPETITGSIGVFAFLPTFENTAAEIGISIDGVGTTPLSSITSLGLAPIDENVGDLLQQSVEHIYGEFLELVADGRNLTPEYVNSIGQGRVWIGETAVQNGLVDKLGTIDDAVAAAASLAELSEYDSVNIIDNESPFDAFFTSFGASVVSTLGLNEERDARRASFLRRIVWQAKQQLEFFDEFNDPYSSYARCLSC